MERIPPIQKTFIPAVIFPDQGGGVPHGVVICVERDPNNSNKMNITVIDPLGRNSGYKKFSDQYVEHIKQALPPGMQTSVVHNEVTTQHLAQNDLYCGYHQVLNIAELAEKGDVQGYIRGNQLQQKPWKTNVVGLFNEMQTGAKGS